MDTSQPLISQVGDPARPETFIHPAPSALSPTPRGVGTRQDRLRPIFIATLIALTIGGSRLAQSLPATRLVRLDFEVVSAQPFRQEIPRTTGLIVIHSDGSGETLVSHAYASDFLDQRTTLHFDVVDPNATRFLFSPAPPGQLVAITGISALEAGSRQNLHLPLTRLSPVQQVTVLDQTADRLVYKTLPGDGLPLLGFELPTRPLARVSVYIFAALDAFAFFVAAFIAGLTALVAIRRFCRPVQVSTSAVIRTLPLFAALGLICVIAFWSRFNAHPDEYLHFESAKYFASHWLPPALDDPATQPSFSHYGVSYLQNLDAAYFAMGKFMALFPPWMVDRETAARLFNCLLFIALAGWLVCRLGRSFAPAILIVTPQIWYIFSYVNGDAWALALSLVTIALLADESSVVSRYLVAHERGPITGGLVLGASLALLLMAKHNYYPLLGFVGLVVWWKCFVWSEPMFWWLFLRKMVVIIATAGALYLPLSLAHKAANRFQLPAIQVEQAEKFAAPMFKPSAIAAGKGAPWLGLRDRGTSFFGVLTSDWSIRTFQSFCGTYHWMSLPSPSFYYWILAGLYLALLAVLGVGFSRLPAADLSFCSLIFLLGFGQVLLSAYHSWVADFQPQGRYLFPILPMFAFLFHRYREWLSVRALNLLFASLFGLSAFSFVFTGIRYFFS